jgi:hypothetical protein
MCYFQQKAPLLNQFNEGCMPIQIATRWSSETVDQAATISHAEMTKWLLGAEAQAQQDMS